MATTSFTTARRYAGIAVTLLFCLCLNGRAAGQGAAPPVTASSAVGLTHTTGWGNIDQTAIDSFGNWVVVDNGGEAVYEFPAGGGAAITLVAPGGMNTDYGAGNPGILIDPANNLYLEGNYNNCLLMFPFNTAANPWPGLTAIGAEPKNAPSLCSTTSGGVAVPPTFAEGGNYENDLAGQYYFQPWGIAIGNNSDILIGNHPGGARFIWSLPVTGAWSSPVAVQNDGTLIITGMAAPALSLAQDPEGDIFFVEDYNDTGSLPGVYEIPAGTTGLTSDSGLTRVDPNLPAVSGVITDAQGNLYISDSQAGVFMVPNPSGTPETSSAVMLTSVPAQGEVAIDWNRNVMYVPTTQSQSNGQADVAKIGFGYAEFGSSPVGTAATPGVNVAFGFNASTTPASFVVVQDGMSKPDFAITGGTCTTGIAYAANVGCLKNVTFTPSAVGSATAKLMMLDANGKVLSSILLHGTGMGATSQISPGKSSTFGSGLQTPTQIALDALGNTYVADPGAGKVLMFAAGSSGSATGLSIGTGLQAPTGVAVDGAGDVFIADSGAGRVYEVPMGPAGLNAAGQVTIASSLGTNLNLAADGLGNVYVADPLDKRVVKLSNVGADTSSTFGQSETMLTTGFNAPTAVAVGSNNNLYVVDGADLFKLIGGAGSPTTLLSNLSGATGLAVDPSGAVYVSSTTGTTRIPIVGAAPAIALSAASASSVALDRAGNAYMTATAGGGVTLVSTNGALTMPTPASLTSSSSLDATVINAGNAPLLVTGYTSTDSVDFTAADGSCVADSTSPATGVAVGGDCTVDVTFAPGAGSQGLLTSTIGITSNAVNSPATIAAAGTALALSNSTTTVAVGATAQVIGTPVTVTVASSSGSGVTPSGTVTISFPSWTVVVPTSGTNAGKPTINPVTLTATATLSGGSATFNLAPVLAGSDSFSVAYSGDRVYGKSTGAITAAVKQSAVTGIALPTFPVSSDINLPFVLEQNGSTPYDGSQTPWQYQFQMTVNTAFGIPTGVITMMDNSSTCPPGTLATGIGTATCALTGLSGVACPQSAGAATLTIENAGNTLTGAGAEFATSCLPMPQNTTYTPFISTHYITPVYGGDANFLPFTGASTLLQVVRSPAVQIATSSSSSLTAAPTLTVTPGSTASVNLTLTSVLGYGIAGRNAQLNDYNFPVTLACDSLPPHSACIFTYPNPDPNISTAVDITCPASASTTQVAAGTAQCTSAQATVTLVSDVTVGTTTSRNAAVASITLASFFGFGTIALFFRRRAFEKGRLLLMIGMMVVGGALAVSVTACNTTNLSPNAVLSTPVGNYAMTITAQQVGTQTINLPTGPVQIYGSENQVSLPFYLNVTVQ